MFNKQKKFWTILVALSTLGVLNAQDLHFANVQRMGQWYNPALKMHNQNDLLFNFRDIRYQNFMAFQTGAALLNLSMEKRENRTDSYDKSFGNVILGAAYDQSNSGLYKNAVSLAGLSYAVKLNRSGLYMSAGFQGAFTSARFGQNALFQDQFDQYGPISGQVTMDPMRSGRTYKYFSLNAGWSMFYKSQNIDWYAGLSIRHVNRPFTEETRNAALRLPSTYGIQAGVTIKNESSALDIFSVVNLKAKAYEVIGGLRYNFLLGANTYDAENSAQDIMLGIGCVYRWKDALIPEIQLTVGKTGLGLHYDMNMSGIRANSFTRRGFELQLTRKF